jgi:hypothetical protein
MYVGQSTAVRHKGDIVTPRKMQFGVLCQQVALLGHLL